MEKTSPSSRRAWVEIIQSARPGRNAPVALLAEGVGRNRGRDGVYYVADRSPSSRRAWVEIRFGFQSPPGYRSPSSRRAWVEMA